MVLSKLVAVSGLLFLGGCTSFAIGAADPASLRSASVVEACPLGVPSTRLTVSDDRSGVRVRFSTRQANLDELRARVRDQARAHGPGRHEGRGHFGEHRGAREHGLQLWRLGAVVTSVEDDATGAILVVTPEDHTRRDEVRERLIARVARIEAAGCPELGRWTLR